MQSTARCSPGSLLPAVGFLLFGDPLPRSASPPLLHLGGCVRPLCHAPAPGSSVLAPRGAGRRATARSSFSWAILHLCQRQACDPGGPVWGQHIAEGLCARAAVRGAARGQLWHCRLCRRVPQGSAVFSRAPREGTCPQAVPWLASGDSLAVAATPSLCAASQWHGAPCPNASSHCGPSLLLRFPLAVARTLPPSFCCRTMKRKSNQPRRHIPRRSGWTLRTPAALPQPPEHRRIPPADGWMCPAGAGGCAQLPQPWRDPAAGFGPKRLLCLTGRSRFLTSWWCSRQRVAGPTCRQSSHPQPLSARFNSAVVR